MVGVAAVVVRTIFVLVLRRVRVFAERVGLTASYVREPCDTSDGTNLPDRRGCGTCGT